MANIGTLTAHIGVDNMGLNRGLTQAQGRFSQFSAGAMKSIAKIGGAFAALGLAVGGLAVFRSITKTGIDFEQTMTTVAGVMRATADESKRLGAAARLMGETTEWSASEAGGALQFLGMAGFEAGKAIKALPGTLDLATAGQIGLGRAADIATNALTAMGLEVEELERVNDVFVGTITRSNTNMEMMAESFKYAAPVARAYGYTVEELSGLIGMLGNAGIQGCFDNKTEVLTKRGWVHWSEVTRTDEFATVNPETNHIEYQKPQRLIRYHHKGKMYLVTNQSVNLCVTPDHRMWVKPRRKDDFRFITAKEVDGKAVRYQAGGLGWKGNNEATHTLDGCSRKHFRYTKNLPPVSIDAKVWARFLGWYIAEGSCDHRNGTYRIRITQLKSQIRAKMRRALVKLPWKVLETKAGFEIHSQQLYRAVAPLGKQPERYIPAYAKNWSPRLLEILFRSLIEGDGCRCKGLLYYCTSSPRLRDDVSEIALKLGYAISTSLSFKKGHQRFFKRDKRIITWKHDIWRVNIRKVQIYPWYSPYEYKGTHGQRLDGSRFPARSEWIDYDGEVFCAEVPNHLLIVRRGGKVVVSGNSMAGTQLAMAIQKTNVVAEKFGVEGGKFVDVLERLREKGYKSTEVMTAFGLRAGRAAGVLYEATDATKKFQETLGGVQGEAKRLADTMRSTVGASFKELKSVIESLALDVFETYRDELRGLVTDTTAWIRRNKETIVDFADAVTKVFSSIIKVINELGKAIGQATQGFSDFAENMKTDTEEAATSLADFVTKMQVGLVPPDFSIWQKFWTLMTNLWIDIGQVMFMVLRQIETTVAAVVEGIIITIGAAWKAMSLDFQGALEEIKKTGDVAVGTWESWLDAWNDMAANMRTLDPGKALHNYWIENNELLKEYQALLDRINKTTGPQPPPTVSGAGGVGGAGGAMLTMPSMPTMPTEGLAEFIARVQDMVAEYKAIQQNRYDWLYAHEKISSDEYLAFLEQRLSGEEMYSNDWIGIQQQIEGLKDEELARDRARWEEKIANQRTFLELMLSGYETFWSSLFDMDMTGKERREAIWEDMKNTFIRYSAEKTKTWIKNALLEKTVTEGVERSKLAAVAAGAAGRIGWAIKEGAAAIASAAKSIYSAAAKIFEAHAWIPFVGVAIAAGFVGAMMAQMGAFKKFHEGGLAGDEILAVLKKPEYVVRESAVRSVGVPALEYINRTGHLPGGDEGAIQLTIGDVIIGSTGTPKDFFLLDDFKDAVVDLIKEKLRNRELIL